MGAIYSYANKGRFSSIVTCLVMATDKVEVLLRKVHSIKSIDHWLVGCRVPPASRVMPEPWYCGFCLPFQSAPI